MMRSGEPVYGVIVDATEDTARVVLVHSDTIVGEREWAATPRVGVEILESLAALLEEAGVSLEQLGRLGVVVAEGQRSSRQRAAVVVRDILSLALAVESIDLVGGKEKDIVGQLMA